MNQHPLPQTIATATAAMPATPFSEGWLRQLRRGLTWIGGKPKLAAGFSVTTDQRQAINRHRQALQQSFRSAATDARALAVELAKLLAALPSQNVGEKQAELRADAYFEALDGQPVWAVAEARRRIIRGETNFGQPFAPTPAELTILVRLIVRTVRDDLADLAALSDATPLAEEDPMPPGDREAIAAGFDELRAALRGPDVVRAPIIDPAKLAGLPDQPPGFWERAAAR